jgi:hypothetical protein
MDVQNNKQCNCTSVGEDVLLGGTGGGDRTAMAGSSAARQFPARSCVPVSNDHRLPPTFISVLDDSSDKHRDTLESTC